MTSSSTESPSESFPTPFSAESYFETQLPPPNLDSDVAGVRSFVERHAQEGRKVVLVTVSNKGNNHLALSLLKDRVVEQRFPWSSMCESRLKAAQAVAHDISALSASAS